MPARLEDTVLPRLDALIQQGNTVVQSYRDSKWGISSHLPEQTLRAFVVAAASEVARVAGRDSEFFRQLQPPLLDGGAISTVQTVPQAALGVLLALRDAVAGGHLEQLATRVRAALHDDFLQQAADLLDGGYHIAAMVIIGGVLENRLRQLCTARALAPARQQLNAYNEALRDRQYTQATWRRIQAFGDVRNNAAHGLFDQVTRAQVQDEFAFAQSFLAEHEA
jgi:hypothetical protein